MQPFRIAPIRHRLLWLLTVVAVFGCEQPQVQNDLEAPGSRGELVVITRNNAACYYDGPHGPAGLEYDLVKAFADHLGLSLRLRTMDTEAEMVAALRAGAGDIIAAGFAFGADTARLLALGPGYLQVKHHVVGRRGGPDLSSKQALEGLTLWMTDSSTRIELLAALQHRRPAINWRIVSAFNAEDLLEMVWKRSLPLTVLDSTILSVNHHYYPELIIRLTLGQPQQVRWATDPRNRRLHQAILAWFGLSQTRQLIRGRIDHYFGHLETLDYVDLVRFRRRVKTRLPQFQPYFEAAAQAHNLDWMLVAALAYQESHWDPLARSYTGVRGIMMLTRDTAAHLGLEDRLDVENSIDAGTDYLARLHRRLGDAVPEPDRTLMALAAYNIGFGHLQDARILADRLGKPADRWHGVRSVLPLLQEQQHYRTLNHRHARGEEAVRHVDRIRIYHAMLKALADATAPDGIAPNQNRSFPDL